MNALRLCALCLAFSPACVFFAGMPAAAEVRDSVAAFVDNQAITVAELRDQHRKTTGISPGISEFEVLNTMINRLLLLRDAKRYRIEAPTSDEVLKEYIDLKVRAFIRVSEDEAAAFYQANSERFGQKDYLDVRDDIEEYIIERELNVRLKDTIRELRKNAYIRINIPVAP